MGVALAVGVAKVVVEDDLEEAVEDGIEVMVVVDPSLMDMEARVVVNACLAEEVAFWVVMEVLVIYADVNPFGVEGQGDPSKVAVSLETYGLWPSTFHLYLSPYLLQDPWKTVFQKGINL